MFEKLVDAIENLRYDGLKRCIATDFSLKGFVQRSKWILQNIEDDTFADRPKLDFEKIYDGEQIKMHQNKYKLRPKFWGEPNIEPGSKTAF